MARQERGRWAVTSFNILEIVPKKEISYSEEREREGNYSLMKLLSYLPGVPTPIVSPSDIS